MYNNTNMYFAITFFFFQYNISNCLDILAQQVAFWQHIKILSWHGVTLVTAWF